MGLEEIPGLRDRVATWIRASQKAEGLSESAWARKYGFSQHQVNAWVSVKSRTVPSLENLQKLATLFRIPWQVLLIGSQGVQEAYASMKTRREGAVDKAPVKADQPTRQPAHNTGHVPGVQPGQIVGVGEIGPDVYEIKYASGKTYRGPLRRLEDSDLLASAARNLKTTSAGSRPQRRKAQVEPKGRVLPKSAQDPPSPRS